MYPIGLILSLLWLQIPYTIENRIKSDNKCEKRIGIIHFIGISIITIFLIINILLRDDNLAQQCLL